MQELLGRRRARVGLEDRALAPTRTATSGSIVRDDDFEDLVTTVHLIAPSSAHAGSASSCWPRCSASTAASSRCYWIYGYKRGAFWPFVPTGEGPGARQRGGAASSRRSWRRSCRSSRISPAGSGSSARRCKSRTFEELVAAHLAAVQLLGGSRPRGTGESRLCGPQPGRPSRRAGVGRGHRRRVGAFRRVRRLRLRAGRRGGRRDRRARPAAAGGARRSVRGLARRPLSARALPARDDARRLGSLSPARPSPSSRTLKCSSSRSPPCSGSPSTLIRPALQALLPSLARTPEELIASNGATSTIESLGTLVGPLLAGVLVSVADVGLVFAVGAGRVLRAASSSCASGSRPASAWSRPTKAATRRLLAAGFRTIARAPRARARRRADRRAGVRPRLPERPDRRRGVPRSRRRRGGRSAT